MSPTSLCTLSYSLQGRTTKVQLEPRETLVGRSAARDVYIRDDSISRKHAAISHQDGRWFIRDLGSKNGVHFNGARTEEHEIHDGDVVRIGSIDLLFGLRGAAIPAQSEVEFEEDENYSTMTQVLQVDDINTLLASGMPTAIDAPDGPAAPGPAPDASDSSSGSVLSLFSSAAEALLSCSELEEMFSLILDLVFEHLPAKRGSIFTCDGDKDSEEQLSQVLARTREGEEQSAMAISRTIARNAIRGAEATCISDAFADDDYGAQQSIVNLNIRSAMAAPLVHKEDGKKKIRGLIYVDTDSRDEPFREGHLQILVTLALISAVAVEKTRLKRLERYSSPVVAARILASGQDFQSEELTITTLFADITGFTKMAAAMSPIDVTNILNAVFERLAQAVFDSEGTLDKFIGDEVMAFWGAPVPQKDQATRAIRCALSMQASLAEYNAEHEGEHPLAISIGINTGPAVVGDIGSPKRKDYTVIGASVNLAKRVEAHAAQSGQVAVGETTFEAAQDGFEFEENPPIEMKNVGQVKTWLVLS